MTLIVITGDRHWTKKSVIQLALRPFGEDLEVVQGGAPGADRLAMKVCMAEGWLCHQFDANWRRYGRGAGPVRNGEMIDLDPDVVFAFHDDLWGESRGTRNCVEQAMARSISVVLWKTDGTSEDLT